jgi:predicted MFS family arabinose efflux permease
MTHDDIDPEVGPPAAVDDGQDLPLPPEALHPDHRRRGLVFLGGACALASFTMAVQMGLNANFLSEDIGASGFQVGMLEAVRESCGILALLLLALLAGLGEPRIGAAMLVLVAFGIGAYAYVPSYAWVVAMSLVWSQGLHIWMPLPHSMGLSLAEPGRAGHRLGQLGAAAAAGFAGGIVVALALNYFGIAMRPMYLVAGVAAALAAACCLGIPHDIKAKGPKFVFRKKYGLYYVLSFLEGWRKQIFVAFAAYLLVEVHGTDLGTMLMLWGGVQVIGYFTSPRVGKLIDRVGERRILTFYFSCLMLFFLGYALVENVYVLYGLFVVDSAFFVFAMALTTYVNRIAPPEEHTPTLSMGVAMNHVAAVSMPLVGGFAWKYLGYSWTFAFGAMAAAISVFVARRIPPRSVGSPTT